MDQPKTDQLPCSPGMSKRNTYSAEESKDYKTQAQPLKVNPSLIYSRTTFGLCSEITRARKEVLEGTLEGILGFNPVV